MNSFQGLAFRDSETPAMLRIAGQAGSG